MEYEGEQWVQGAEAQAVEVEAKVKVKAQEVQEVKANVMEVE